MKPINLSVLQKTAQEALARGMAAKQPASGGVECVWMEVDRRVLHRQRLT
jgi:hypothetical protein